MVYKKITDVLLFLCIAWPPPLQTTTKKTRRLRWARWCSDRRRPRRRPRRACPCRRRWTTRRTTEQPATERPEPTWITTTPVTWTTRRLPTRTDRTPSRCCRLFPTTTIWRTARTVPRPSRLPCRLSNPIA